MKLTYFLTLAAGLVLLLLLSACKNDSGTEIKVIEYNELIINLDKEVYKPEASAHLTIINKTKKDLILLNCGTSPGFDLQKNIVGKWNNVSLMECPNIGQPFEILQGERREFDIALPPLSLNPNEVEGQYRLLLWLKDKASDQFLDKSERATDPFRITN